MGNRPPLDVAELLAGWMRSPWWRPCKQQELLCHHQNHRWALLLSLHLVAVSKKRAGLIPTWIILPVGGTLLRHAEADRRSRSTTVCCSCCAVSLHRTFSYLLPLSSFEDVEVMTYSSQNGETFSAFSSRLGRTERGWIGQRWGTNCLRALYHFERRRQQGKEPLGNLKLFFGVQYS